MKKTSVEKKLEEQESEEDFQTVAQQIPNVFMLDNDVPSQSNLPMSQ